MQYRPEWGNYAQGCDALIFVVDCSNVDNIMCYSIIIAIHTWHVQIGTTHSTREQVLAANSDSHTGQQNRHQSSFELEGID